MRGVGKAERLKPGRASSSSVGAYGRNSPNACRVSYRGGSSSVSRWRGPWSASRSVLLLDEPLSALDPFLRIKRAGGVEAAAAANWRISFIHVTHSQDEAMALADMMVVMQDGHIRQSGTPRDVFGNPASSFVARFIGGHNVLPGAAGPVAVRADRCRLKPDGAGHNSAGLAARVEAVEYQGGTVRVALMVTETGEGASVLLPDDEYDAAPVAAGTSARLVWSPADERRLAA